MAVAARFDDEDKDVRRAAVTAVSGRAVLPDRVLTAVAARLDDEDGNVRRAAANLLMHRLKLCRTVLKGSLIASLYKTLLERSFKEQLSWYIEEDNSCVNLSDGITELSVDIEQTEVREWIKGARPVDYPSTTGVLLSGCQFRQRADGKDALRLLWRETKVPNTFF